MSFPNYPEFAEEFAAKATDRLYIADGYSEETNINNMIVQLLILEGYISSDDLARGQRDRESQPRNDRCGEARRRTIPEPATFREGRRTAPDRGEKNAGEVQTRAE